MNSIYQECGQTFTDNHKLAAHSLNHAKDELKQAGAELCQAQHSLG